MNGAAETLLQLRSLVVCHPVQSFFVPTVRRFFLLVPALLQLAAVLTMVGKALHICRPFLCCFKTRIKAVMSMGKHVEIHW